MGKSSSKRAKRQVTEYRRSIHYGICAGPVDYISQIRIQEKVAWTGIQTDQGSFSINKPNLFGGIKKEGGAVGTVTFLPGASDQVIPESLAAKCGKTSATMPAYRGIASAWFHGGSKGFYWQANSPYIPGTWIKVARASTALDDSLARIPRGNSIHSTEILDLSAVTNAGTTAPAAMAAGKSVTAGEGDIVRLSLPTGQTYVAWSPWGKPAYTGGNSGSSNRLDVYRNDNSADVVLLGDRVNFHYDGYEAARAAFGTEVLTGSTKYTFAIVDTIIGDNSGGLSVKVEIFREWDSNPAHIIYDCLTNTDWGMGGLTSQIDTDSFLYAAQVFFDEGLGLSFMWKEQTSIETLIREVLDHVEATLYVAPSTGLLTLKPIRDDYVVEDLPVFTPDNSRVVNFSRKLWGETINEIVATWTDPDNEQDATVVAQDNANIVMQGGIVSDGRNFYGVRTQNIAMKLAQRDLRAASTPLATCEIELDRSAWDLVPGDVIVLNSPEDQINALVMRVGPVDYGKAGDAKIRASLVEDVFGYAVADYATAGDTQAVTEGEEPTPPDFSYAFTLPYYASVNMVPSLLTLDAEYPEVIAGVLAGEEGDDCDTFELIGDTLDAAGNTVTSELGTLTIAAHATLAEGITAEAETTFTDFPDLTQGSGPMVGGLMIIQGASEAATEFCLVTSAVSGGYTVKRGVLDTVPRDWSAGSNVWFIDSDMVIYDSEIRSAAEDVNYKILLRTSLGILDEADADTLNVTLTARPHLPSRPANVVINGTAFGDVNAIDVDPIPITWSRRNRLTEDAQIRAWDDGDVTPESGQTVTIVVSDRDGVELTEITGLTGTSYNLPASAFAGEPSGYVTLLAVRDGLESLQGYSMLVRLTEGFRLLESEGFRLLEDGGRRLLEDG